MLWPHQLGQYPASMGDPFCLFREVENTVHASQACIFYMLMCTEIHKGQSACQLALPRKPESRSCRNIPGLILKKTQKQSSFKTFQWCIEEMERPSELQVLRHPGDIGFPARVTWKPARCHIGNAFRSTSISKVPLPYGPFYGLEGENWR